MHILFLTDNFPPEGNAPATRTYEHAREWVKQGHNVTVVTSAPNFPEGKLYEGYKNNWYQKSVLEGIEVRRVKTYITANDGFVKRTLDFMSFMVSGFFAGIFVKNVDLIVATSPQFFTTVAGHGLSVFKRKPFVFELRDIWPASIYAVGAMKKSAIISLLEKLELYLYRRAAKIISVTNSFKSELVARGVKANKIDVVRNGVDLSTYSRLDKDQELLKRYKLDGKFVVGYLGTQGLAHGLEYLIDAAKLLEKNENIVFVFVGTGSASQMLKEKVEHLRLKNVLMLGRQEKSMMPNFWSLSDISVVHLKNAPLFQTVIPSKIFESMGMGLPILISMPEGEATSIVTKHSAGVVVTPESPELLAEKIMQLCVQPDLLKELSQSALQAAKHFDRKTLANEMLTSLKQVYTDSLDK